MVNQVGESVENFEHSFEELEELNKVARRVARWSAPVDDNHHFCHSADGRVCAAVLLFSNYHGSEQQRYHVKYSFDGDVIKGFDVIHFDKFFLSVKDAKKSVNAELEKGGYKFFPDVIRPKKEENDDAVEVKDGIQDGVNAVIS
ncbi:hypothetical protein ACFL21_05320 [Patescibacteria group bacterium]